jgi:glucose dehydrogenase
VCVVLAVPVLVVLVAPVVVPAGADVLAAVFVLVLVAAVLGVAATEIVFVLEPHPPRTAATSTAASSANGVVWAMGSRRSTVSRYSPPAREAPARSGLDKLLVTAKLLCIVSSH